MNYVLFLESELSEDSTVYTRIGNSDYISYLPEVKVKKALGMLESMNLGNKRINLIITFRNLVKDMEGSQPSLKYENEIIEDFIQRRDNKVILMIGKRYRVVASSSWYLSVEEEDREVIQGTLTLESIGKIESGERYFLRFKETMNYY